MKHLEEVIINYDKKLMEANAEIERLHSIIKEAREYMEDNSKISLDDTISIINFYRQLLEILKGSDKEC